VPTPVHDADHDRPGVRRHLDEIEAGIGRDAAGFFDGDDADLLTIGTDETDGAQPDLFVDTNLVLDDGGSPLCSL